MTVTVGRILILTISVIAVLSCNDDRVTDQELSDGYQITQFINNEPAGIAAFPLVWIDSISRAEQYAKLTGQADINPLDYWVEVLNFGRSITIADSCARDEFNEGQDSCDVIQLVTGARARTRITLILDSIVCRYHIVDRLDSSVTTKDVKYKEAQYALCAKLDNNNTAYRGWRLYGIGRHRYGVGYTQSAFPAIDSIVLASRANPNQRLVGYPTQRIRYVALSQLPTFYAGEPLRITAYTRARFSTPIREAYLHYNVNGTIRHEWMGPDISTDELRQIFEIDIDESSGQQSGLYAKIAVELFQEHSLRDESPSAFSNLIWGFTYRLE